MENLLWVISNVIVYIDDILVANTLDKERIEPLRRVFAKVQESGLKLNKPNVIGGILWALHIQGGNLPNTREDMSSVRSTSSCKRSAVEIIPGPYRLIMENFYLIWLALWLHSTSF